MSKLDAFKYLDEIPTEYPRAIQMQELTLRDLQIAGFIDPTTIANPEDPALIRAQMEKLIKHPERYSGFEKTTSGLLVAYMKQAEWLSDSEEPFRDTNERLHRVRKLGEFIRAGSLRPRAHGIFGLVVEESLEQDTQKSMAETLIRSAIDRAKIYAEVINIVLADGDPTLPVVRDLNFKPKGPLAEALGAPGLEQMRYQLTL